MIPILTDSEKPRYHQVYEFFRDAILANRLAHNTRLPSHRTLARELNLAVNTVLKAYEQLVLEGYVVNQNRRGLFVAKIDSSDWLLNAGRRQSFSPVKKTKLKYSASVHLVDESHFPIKEWRKCSNWALDKISFQYQEHEHDEPLKQQLISYLYTHRGVRATQDQLIIGSGASTLLFWLAFVMRKDINKVVVEDPGYPRIRNIFAEFGYAIKPVGLKSDGIDIKKLNAVKADLIVLTPSHQYPTGAAIPVSNRLRILQWARKNNAFVIEDDFDCEFRYKAKLMPALQGLDVHHRVIYIGTFSSALMPSLRVAYAVLPQYFPARYRKFDHLTNTVPYFTRRTLEHFMERGFWERHLKKMRKIYKIKYDTCVHALRKIPSKHIAFNNTPSGLNILLHINSRLSENELIDRASNIGILVTPTSTFYCDDKNRPSMPQVLFEFGSVPTEEISKIVERLYKVWFPIRKAKPSMKAFKS